MEGNGITSPELADMATVLATRTADQLIGDLNRMKGRITHTTPVIQGVDKGNGHHAEPSAEPSAAEELEDDNTSDDESEVEVEVVNNISAKRRRENAVLESHRLNRARQLATEPKKQENVNEDKQSTKWLVKHSTNQEIISTPREYQSELFEKAKEKNIIAVLDTGLFGQL
jgi:endoribonuclease Dicer